MKARHVVRTAAMLLIALLALPASSSEKPEAPINDIDVFLASCPSEPELRILERDFPILFDPAMRTADPTYNCTEPVSETRRPSDQLAIYQALRVIRSMTLSVPLPWTDLHPYEWLKSRIGAIVVSYTAQFNSCCRSVAPPGQGENVLAITLQKASADLLRYRTVWRDPSSGTGLGNLILLIFHEARHADLPHDCAGIYDSTLEYLGAWGVQITLARYLADGRIDLGLDAAQQEAMAWLADDLERSRICGSD